MTNYQKFLFFVFLQLCNLAIVVTLLLTGYKTEAQAFSFGGTAIIFGGTTLHIIFYDSRKRWGNDPWHARALKLFTFTR